MYTTKVKDTWITYTYYQGNRFAIVTIDKKNFYVNGINPLTYNDDIKQFIIDNNIAR